MKYNNSVIGDWPDKPMPVGILRSVLREKVTGSKDKSVRAFCMKKLSELSVRSVKRRDARNAQAE